MATAFDPVCNRWIGTDTPWRSDHEGTTYYFDSEDCKRRFDARPAGYATAAAGTSGPVRPRPAPAQPARSPQGFDVEGAAGLASGDVGDIDEVLTDEHVGDSGDVITTANVGTFPVGTTEDIGEHLDVPPLTQIDPVCGNRVDSTTLYSANYNGYAYYFDTAECRDRFLASPETYVAAA